MGGLEPEPQFLGTRRQAWGRGLTSFMTDLHWLPAVPDWRSRLRELDEDSGNPWEKGIKLPNARLNFVLTNRLHDSLRRVLPVPRLRSQPSRFG
jgi:hypothetical protein